MKAQLCQHVPAYFVGLLLTSLGFGLGCSRQTAMPNLWHPGPAGYQQYNATVHDPYPLDDVAPPIVGGRPLQFQRPVPEAVRATPGGAPPRAGYPWR